MHIQQRPVSQPRNRVLISLAACGCLVLTLLIVIGLTVFHAGSKDVKEADKVAELFLFKLEKQDHHAAFNLLATQTRNGKTVESIIDVMEVLAKRHGHPVSHLQQPGFYMNTFNGVTSVRLNYHEKFEQGEMPVLIDVVDENGKWLVQAFHFQP